MENPCIMDGRNQKKPNMLQVASLQRLFTKQAEKHVVKHQPNNLFTKLLLENHFAIAAERTLFAENMTEQTTVEMSEVNTLGKHMMVDFKLPDAFLKKLKSMDKPAEYVHQILLNAAIFSGASILSKNSFIEDEFGNISSIIPFEESHILGHVKSGYFILDGFTCGDIDFMKAVNHIIQQFSLSIHDTITFRRGVQKDGAFIPGIANETSPNTLTFFTPKPSTTPKVGDHVIAEFYQCDAGIINSASDVLNIFEDALAAGGVTLKYSFIHEFKPQGITLVTLGSGKPGEVCDITMHNWPENRYAAIDGCALGSGINLNHIIDHLAKAFDAKRVSQATFTRGNIGSQFGLSSQIEKSNSEQSMSFSRPGKNQ